MATSIAAMAMRRLQRAPLNAAAMRAAPQRQLRNCSNRTSIAAAGSASAPSQQSPLLLQLKAGLCGAAAAFTQAGGGIGGGIVLVPTLTAVVGLTQLQATGTSLAALSAAFFTGAARSPSPIPCTLSSLYHQIPLSSRSIPSPRRGHHRFYTTANPCD